MAPIWERTYEKMDLVVTNTLRHHQTIAICIAMSTPYPKTLSRDRRRRPRHRRCRRCQRRRCRHCRPCHVVIASSPCRRHLIARSSPCRRHVVAMPSPCRRHVVAVSSPCRRNAVAMLSPCHGHVILHQLSLPQTPWYILETSAHSPQPSRIYLNYTTVHSLHSLHHHECNCNHTTVIHCTTTTTPLHYSYNCSCPTPHYIQQLWVRWPTRWPLQPLQPLQEAQLQPPFRSISGFALPSVTHSNQPLL